MILGFLKAKAKQSLNPEKVCKSSFGLSYATIPFLSRCKTSRDVGFLWRFVEFFFKFLEELFFDLNISIQILRTCQYLFFI